MKWQNAKTEEIMYFVSEGKKKEIRLVEEKTSKNHPVWLTDCNWKIEMSFGTSKHTKRCSIHSEHNFIFLVFILLYMRQTVICFGIMLCSSLLIWLYCAPYIRIWTIRLAIRCVCMRVRVWFSSITAHSHIRPRQWRVIMSSQCMC